MAVMLFDGTSTAHETQTSRNHHPRIEKHRSSSWKRPYSFGSWEESEDVVGSYSQHLSLVSGLKQGRAAPELGHAARAE